MARLLVIVALLLAPLASGKHHGPRRDKDLCLSEAPLEGEEVRYKCHPENLTVGVACSLVNGTVRASLTRCDPGQFFSVSMRACVGQLLSDCASKRSDTESRYRPLCAEASSDHPGQLFYLCHPNDTTQFIACPPNFSWARSLHCVKGLHFCAKKMKCVPAEKSDCVARASKAEDSKPKVSEPAKEVTSLDGPKPADAKDSDGKGKDEKVAANKINNSKDSNSTDGDASSDGGNDAGPMHYCPPGHPRCNNNPHPTQRPVPTQGPVYPVHPTYPSRRPDPRRLGPGPNPAAACRTRYLYHPEKADWEGARAICEMEGGQLAVITSEREQGRIASRFGKLKEFWIGATDIEREGQFRWVNGQGLGFARWYSSQPNKKYPNNEHCVTFNYWGKDAKWGDRNCFDSRPFLCETMNCRPVRNRFPTGYPGAFKGPLRSPFTFPRNPNFPGPRGTKGYANRHWPHGRGFAYNDWHRIRTPINL